MFNIIPSNLFWLHVCSLIFFNFLDEVSFHVFFIWNFSFIQRFQMEFLLKTLHTTYDHYFIPFYGIVNIFQMHYISVPNNSKGHSIKKHLQNTAWYTFISTFFINFLIFKRLLSSFSKKKTTTFCFIGFSSLLKYGINHYDH